VNAHARIISWQISVFDLPAHISMVASLKLFYFRGRDADEFDALHRSLQDEWEPSGALEEDAVYTILTCIWRKRRIRDKRNLDTLAALQQKDLEALSEMPLPFFDTKEERTTYVLTHRCEFRSKSPTYSGMMSPTHSD
jgi:hypothetical protein